MFVLVNREPHFRRSEISDFPRIFRSADHLAGFCDGRFFGKFRILSDSEVADALNRHGDGLGGGFVEYHVFVVAIIPPIIEERG